MKKRSGRRKPVGWRNHSDEHALASRGVKTTSKGIKDRYGEAGYTWHEGAMKSHCSKDDVAYVAEEGDILNFQSAFYPMKGKWMIKDIWEHPSHGEVMELVKLMKSGKEDKRVNSKTYKVKEIEMSVDTWVDREYNWEKSKHDHQRVELVEERRVNKK